MCLRYGITPNIAAGISPFIDALKRYLSQREDISLIFPVGENELLALCDAYESLSSKVVILMCSPQKVRTCLDKAEMLQIADKLGIPQASHTSVTSP